MRMLFPAIAAVALLGFGSAQAASKDDYQIQTVVNTAGLDMNTAAGADAFNRRIKAAALSVCMQSQGVDSSSAAEYLLDSCVRRTARAAEATPMVAVAQPVAAPAKATASLWAFNWFTKGPSAD